MRRVVLMCLIVFAVTAAGCGGGSGSAKSAHTPNKPPRVVIKRVPCKIKFGPLAAALEVDLSEVRNLALDAKQLYDEIVNGEPSTVPPPSESPVVMVVNKKRNKFTYFTLTPNVKELRLRTANSSEVELNIMNQEPLRVELWVSTDQPIEIDIEFKDATKLQPK